MEQASVQPVLVKTCLSTTGIGLTEFAAAPTEGTYRKDYIRDGAWRVNDPVEPTLRITPARRAKWEKNFRLMMDRGYKIPLTANHIEVWDPKTNTTTVRYLKSGDVEAKLGEVTALFNRGDRGMFDCVPADAKATEILKRVQDVSLEMTRGFRDAMNNYYDEAITAITLTPVPAIPGQQEFTRLAASQSDGQTLYLSAEPFTESKPTENTTMTPELMTRAKTAMKLAPDTDEVATHHKIVEHLEKCGSSSYLSREDHDKEVAKLTTDLAEAKKAATTVKLSRDDFDVDGLDMAARFYQGRIEALAATGKVNLAQKASLLTYICGAPEARPVLCLSRKAAGMVGINDPIAETILSILENAEPFKAPASGTGTKVELERKNPSPESATNPLEYNADLVKEMSDHANGKLATSDTVL